MNQPMATEEMAIRLGDLVSLEAREMPVFL